LNHKRSLVGYLLRRFLRFDPQQPFIFLSAMLAFVGILLGVAVLIIAMSLMNGFSKEFKKQLTTMNYPLTIVPHFFASVNHNLLEELQQKFPELKFSPYVVSSIMTRSGTKIEGGYLFGVDFEAEKEVNAVVAEALSKTPKQNFSVVIGSSLYDEFSLSKGDKLMYIFTQIEPGGLALTPKIKRFKVFDTFSSGLKAYDRAYSYTSIDSLQKVLNLPKNYYDGIHIHSDNPRATLQMIAPELPSNVRIKGWWEDNANFFVALELEKRSLFIVLMLIILIASVNIISSLLMTVMNRRADIALLISLGASPSQIKRLFLYLGVVIGIGGIVVGVALGLGGVWLLQTFDIVSLPKDVYPTSTLALELSTIDLVSIIIGALLIVLLSAWYPASKASKVDVLTVLRNE